MKYLYNFAMFLLGKVLWVLSLFDQKISLFIKGRKETFPRLIEQLSPEDKTLWMHCASLGEFEQGRPILEALYQLYPEYKIVLSFYSPSGYEVRKGYKLAHTIVYLPIDTISNAVKFVDLVHPDLAIFVKYEFWPNMLYALKKKSVPTLLISGIFRKDQLFFKSYGGWMKKSLQTFTHFFVQNQNSLDLLNQIGIKEVTISGDTRFDRVAAITEQNNVLDFLTDFTKDKLVIVAGSTWPEDESMLVNFINRHQNQDLRFIIAPHNIKPKEIEFLKNEIRLPTALYSKNEIISGTKILIVDAIGLLTKIYSYADIAYVGGGFGKEGVHNVLEPAVFGVAQIIGPIYDKFEEATELVKAGGCLVVDSQESFDAHLNTLIGDGHKRKKLGEISKLYIEKNLGATEIILKYIEDQLADIS